MWVPARATFLVPVTALSLLDRALFKAAMRHAGLRARIAPQGWTIPWNVHAQADDHGHSAFSSLAPSVCKVALSHRRLVRRQDRTVTCTSRTGGSARLRTTSLEVLACIRRFLQHVLPHGCMTVRHLGLLPPSCAVPLATIRGLIGQAHSRNDSPSPRLPPPPRVARWPTCGAPRHLVLRVWTASKTCVDTSGAASWSPDARGATRCAQPTAPVRPQAGIRQPQGAQDGRKTACPRLAAAS